MEVLKILGQANPAATTVTQLYTVPIDKGCVVSFLFISNIGGTNETVRVAVINGHIPETGIENKSYVLYDYSLSAGTFFQTLKGCTLAQGDTIAVYASSADIAFSLFGSEFDQTYEYDETIPYGYGYGY